MNYVINKHYMTEHGPFLIISPGLFSFILYHGYKLKVSFYVICSLWQALQFFYLGHK